MSFPFLKASRRTALVALALASSLLACGAEDAVTDATVAPGGGAGGAGGATKGDTPGGAAGALGGGAGGQDADAQGGQGGASETLCEQGGCGGGLPGGGGGVGGSSACTASGVRCQGGVLVPFSCNPCINIDCDMPDGHIDCGNGACVEAGGVCSTDCSDGGCGAGGSPPESCDNGVDDNSDTQIDCDEATCQAACGDPCVSPTAVLLDDALSPAWASAGLWKGHAASFLLGCSPSASPGPSIAYSFTNASDKPGFIQVQASSTGGDVVLARLGSCSPAAVESECKNTSGPGGSEGLSVLLQPGEVATVVVASASPQGQGSFLLSAAFSAPLCGDGVVTPDEECDPLLSEGCSAQCKVTACDGATPVLDGVDGVIHKTPVSSEVITPSCSKLGKSSPEFIYSIRAKNAGLLQAILRSKGATDLNLSLRSSCQGGGGELACADLAPGGEGALERVVVPVAAGQLLFPVVDVYDGSQAGDFDLFARSYPDECGDGVVSPLEQCDGASGCAGDCTTTLPEGTPTESEPNGLAGLASALKGTVGGKIAPAGDVDLYEVKVTKAGVLKVSVDEPGDGSCKRGELSVVPEGVLDSEVRLLRQDGSLVAINDNGPGDGFCSRLEVPVTVGSYLVQVKASSTSPALVFSYLLKVEAP